MRALLLIDIQKGLTARSLYEKENFINTVNDAIQIYRSTNDLIVFVQHENKQLVYGTKDWKIDNRIMINTKDKVFAKTKGDAFSNEDLVSFLKEQNVVEVLIGGLVTHGCIRHTCLGGIKADFSISLLKGGHSNWEKDAMDKIIKTEKSLTESDIEVIELTDIQ